MHLQNPQEITQSTQQRLIHDNLERTNDQHETNAAVRFDNDTSYTILHIKFTFNQR